MSNKYSVTLTDKIVSMFTYLTVGWVGFIYAIIMFFLKRKMSHFLRYNIMQSILISFTYFVLCMVLGLICNILSHIPIIQIIVSWIQLIFNRPVFFGWSIIQTFVNLLFIYMALVSFNGKYPRIYGFSELIERSK